MKAKMLLVMLIAGLMGFLSPAGADQSGQFITYSNVQAKSGATVSALFLGYSKSGGQLAYEDFLTAYCVLQGMKSCGDADFRKLPIGNWKVPAAPVAYYLKNGKAAPETFVFTLTKKNDHEYAPGISEVEASIIAPAVTAPIVAQQPVTQPAAKIPPVALQTFAMPKVETSAKPAEKVAAAQSVTPVVPVVEAQQPEPASSYYGAFPVPKQTVVPVVQPAVQVESAPAQVVRTVVTIKDIGTVSAPGLVAFVFAVVLMVGLCTAYGIWRFLKKKFNKNVEAVVWHRDELSTENENLRRERDRLLREKKEAAGIIKDLSAQLVDTQVELTEAKKVSLRFDLPLELVRDDGLRYIYLGMTPEGLAEVANNPDPMKLSSVRGHFMNSEVSRNACHPRLRILEKKYPTPSLIPATSVG